MRLVQIEGIVHPYYLHVLVLIHKGVQCKTTLRSTPKHLNAELAPYGIVVVAGGLTTTHKSLDSSASLACNYLLLNK